MAGWLQEEAYMSSITSRKPLFNYILTHKKGGERAEVMKHKKHGRDRERVSCYMVYAL